MAVQIERVFCPVDIYSERIGNLFLPLRLNQDFGAKVYFCYCRPKNSLGGLTEDQERLVDLVAESFDPLKSEASGAPIAYETIVVETQEIAKEIARQAANVGSDIIDIRSSRVPARGISLGPIAEAVCRDAPCPVLVSRPVDNIDGIDFRKILAAHDFSDYSELALQNAFLLANKFAAELHLLHILPEPLHKETDLTWAEGTVKELYYQTINRLQASIHGDHARLPQILVSVRWGKTYKEIISYVQENTIDLVTMGAHGADCEAPMLFGSNIDRVLRLSPSAVLIAHHRKLSSD